LSKRWNGGKIFAMAKPIFMLPSLLALLSGPLGATCWDSASESYGIPVEVLKAVARAESGFDPQSLHRNRDGSRDIGMMQINSAWLPTLARYGIDEVSLANACTNLKVGAWILANNAKKHGWTWKAIGAYNVGCARLDARECARRRADYAWKIHDALKKADAIEAPRHSLPARAAPATKKGLRRGGTQDRVIQMVRLDLPQKQAVLPEESRPRETVPEETFSSFSMGAFLNYEDIHAN
jgi:hypothetical protein